MPTARQRQRLLTLARFSPRRINGLQFWFTASSILGLADTDAIASWGDSSNNGYIATEATNRPGYKIDQIGTTYPAVLWDGANDRLTMPSVTHGIGTGDFTIYVIVRSSNVALLYKTMLSAGSGGDPGLYFKSSVVDLYWGTDRNFATSLSNNTWYLFCLERVAGTVSLYVNGILDANSFTITTSLANSAWYLGNEDTGTAATLNGNLAEALLYKGSHTIDQRVKMESYFNTRYRIF